MKKTNILTLFLFMLIFISSCNNEKSKLSTTINYIEECIPNENGKITEKDAAFSYHSSTSVLTINKINNFYSCKGEVKISATIKNNIIQITEQTETNTDCKCPKNMSYTIGNIPSGSYKISINNKIIGEILIY